MKKIIIFFLFTLSFALTSVASRADFDPSDPHPAKPVIPKRPLMCAAYDLSLYFSIVFKPEGAEMRWEKDDTEVTSPSLSQGGVTVDRDWSYVEIAWDSGSVELSKKSSDGRYFGLLTIDSEAPLDQVPWFHREADMNSGLGKVACYWGS